MGELNNSLYSLPGILSGDYILLLQWRGKDLRHFLQRLLHII